METLSKNNKIINSTHSNDVQHYIDGIKQTIDKLNEFIKFNELTINNSIKFDESLIKIWCHNEGLCSRKKFKRIVNNCHLKPTLASYNRFLHFLYKIIYRSDVRIKITYSDKHQLIINNRKEYVKARKLMLAALNKYKNEKGDFYKQRIAKGQIIQ